MTLMKRSDNYRPSLPSLFDNLFSRDLMDWGTLISQTPTLHCRLLILKKLLTTTKLRLLLRV